MAKKKEETVTVDLDADFSADDIISSLLKSDDDIEAIQGNEVEIVDPVKMVPTGLIPLDVCFGGGITKGRMYEVSGPESHGKSTLCDTIVANWMKNEPNSLCLRIESESTMDPIRSEMIGINLKRMMVFSSIVQEECFEQIAKVQDQLYNKYGNKVPLLIVWDTLTAAAPRVEIESDNANGAGMMKNARINSQELRKLNGRCAKYGHSAIIIQQVREDGVDMYGNTKYKTTGGQALKHYVSSRVMVKRRNPPIYKDNDKNKDIVGYVVELDMLKNKMTGLTRPVPTYMNLLEGFDPYQSAAMFALENNNAAPFIKAGGAGWLTVTDHLGKDYLKVQGATKLADILKEDAYLLKLIEYAAYYNKMFSHELWKKKYENLVKKLYNDLEVLMAEKSKDAKKDKEVSDALDAALENVNV